MVSIPWGMDESLDLAFTQDWNCTVHRPDLSNPVADYAAALESALDHAIDGGAVFSRVSPGARVAIVVDDPSRWTPVRDALPRVIERLHRAGVRDSEISISVGVGRHNAVDANAMRTRVGEAIVDRYPCYSPPVDDRSSYADLGTTPEGIPVRVFRPVAEADVRVLIGSVLPHLQAGFGGGYKLIFPGASHRSTLGALHAQGLRGKHLPAERLLGGDLAANPMRRAICAAAERIGPCLSISHLIGAPGEVLRVCAGHPDAVQEALAAEARARLAVPVEPPADMIVAGNHPWPGDPMQSFKVLLHHRAGCRPGGVLAGFFWTDPAEIDRSFPLSLLRLIASTGSLGGGTIRHGLRFADRLLSATGSPSAFMLHWARELVVDRAVLVYAPPLHDRLGPHLGPVRLFADQPSLWQAAHRILARNHTLQPRVHIFPQGGLTYVPATKSR